MMNIGTRQQDATQDPEGRVAARADDYQNPPGAFPETPSETPQESGKHHNKLHKPNDPRGWSQSEREAHGYGLMDDTTTTNTIANTTNTTTMGAHHPTQAERTVGYDNRHTSDSSLRRESSPSRTTNHSYAVPNQGSTTTGLESRQKHGHEDAGRHGLGTSAAGATDVSPRAGEQSHSQTGIPPVADTSEHPYWGDLPVGGAVYNTVTGHGSHEDDEIRRRVATKDESSLGSTVPTKSDNVNTSQRYEAQPRADPIGHGQTHTHAPGHAERSREEKDLHRGGAVAGSAHAYDQHRHRDAVRQNPEEHAQERKENKGILGTVLGLGGSKKDDKDKEEQHAKAEKEHKTKEHKDHGLASIFHHGTKTDESKHDEPRRAPRQDERERLSKDDGAFAAMGARTAFVAAPTSHVDETRSRPPSSQYEQPTPQERVGHGDLSSGAVSGLRTGETGSPYARDVSSPDSYRHRQDDHDHGSHDDGTTAVIAAVGLGTAAFAYGNRERGGLNEDPIMNTSTTTEPFRDSQAPYGSLPSNTYGTSTTTDQSRNTHDPYNPLASNINTTTTTSTTEPFRNTQTSYSQLPADTYTTGTTTTTAPFRDTEDSYNPPPSNTYRSHTTATDPFKDNQALYDSLPSNTYDTSTAIATDRSKGAHTTYGQPLSNTYGAGISGTAHPSQSTEASYDLSSSNTYGTGTTDTFREPRDAIGPNVTESTPTPATGFSHPRGDHDHSAVAENKHHADSSQTKRTPALAEHANNAEYNLLASGTPSGVKIDDNQ